MQYLALAGAQEVIIVQAEGASAQLLGRSMAGNVLAERLGRGAALLAPMSGITDAVFRGIAHRFGAAMVVTEMVASDALARREQEAVLRSEGAGIVPHVVQLAGCDTRLLAEAARLSEGAGASVIDINMGCPAKRVVGGWAGSALMRDLDHAVSIIDAVIAAVAIPVTVKMRLGWDDGTRNASVLAKRAVGAGARMITVHGRTRCQFYKGRADWKAIRDVVEAVPAPVVCKWRHRLRPRCPGLPESIGCTGSDDRAVRSWQGMAACGHPGRHSRRRRTRPALRAGPK